MDALWLDQEKVAALWLDQVKSQEKWKTMETKRGISVCHVCYQEKPPEHCLILSVQRTVTSLRTTYPVQSEALETFLYPSAFCLVISLSPSLSITLLIFDFSFF